MAINAADGSKVLRTIFPEAVAGTAAAGAYQTLRLKAGAKIELTRNLIQSNELRSDRQQSAPGNGTKSVSVSLPIEWSYGTHDALLEAAMGGTWTADVLKVGNVVRTSAIEETHTDVGMLERATGVQFGMFSISKKGDAIVEGEFSGIGRALKIAQTTGVNLAYDSTGKTITRATAGFITKDGWAVGDSITGLGNADAGNNNTTPWTITTLTDTVMTFTTATGIVTKASAAGITLNLGTVATSVVAATTNAPWDSLTGTVSEGGVVIGSVTGWDLSVEQEVKPLNALGSDTAQGSRVGVLKVSGNLSIYFENETFRKKFANGTSTSLSLVMGNTATGTLQFDMGTVRYSSNTKNSDDAEIIQTAAFSATYTATDTTLKITRTAPA